MSSLVEKFAKALLQSRRIVVFTGAGMSADSGIATFRNDSSSHWSRFNPQELASPQGWETNHKRVWAWYEARRANVMAAVPNAGHVAIAQLADVLSLRTHHRVQVSVVTQNVDNLHERAGSTDVLHLHGSLFAPRCDTCHQAADCAPGLPDPQATELEPPRCAHCAGHIRPGVVWFGEALPEDEFAQAQYLVEACDAMLVVGTSGVVYPAAGLPVHAARLGKFVAEINPMRSDISACMSEHWGVPAATGLSQLLDLLRSDWIRRAAPRPRHTVRGFE